MLLYDTINSFQSDVTFETTRPAVHESQLMQKHYIKCPYYLQLIKTGHYGSDDKHRVTTLQTM